MRCSFTSLRAFAAAALAAALFTALGCGGTTTDTAVGPSGSTRCEISVRNDTPEVPASGGNGTLTVTSARDCSWSATAEASWITLQSTSGQGSSTLTYSVIANPAGRSRRGRVVVSEQAVEIAQAASPCRYEVVPASLDVDASQGQVAVNVSAPEGCEWRAQSDVPWIADIQPAQGAGNGTVRFTVAQNTAEARSGTVAFGNATARINQAARGGPGTSPSPSPAPNCSYNVSPTRFTVAPGGDQVSIEVTAQPGCPWTARSSAPSWITIVSATTGTGNGAIRANVSANNGAPRTATISVGDRTVTIEQRAPAAPSCTYSIKPTYYNAGRGPDDITIEVAAPNGCAWTTATDANWVSVNAGRTGSGTGTVRLHIPANTGAPRTALVTIATHTFTLQQEGPCTNTIKPGHYNAGRGPDDIRIEVTADSGCSWTAASTVSWVTVAEGRTGSGNGTVRLLVEPNSGAARSVTLSIAGQPFELRQNGQQ